MKRRLLAIATIALAGAACAPLRSAPLPAVGPPEFGIVAAKRATQLKASESRGERAAWALMSLDPFVVAAATLGVEDEFGQSLISEYDIDLSGGGRVTVQSRYIVALTQCVMLRRSDDNGHVILVAQDAQRCAPNPSAPPP